MLRDLRENIFFYFIILISVLLAVSNFFMPFSMDVALHFFHSIRFMKEGGLYTRWVEVMPPTIYLIYSVPIWLQGVIHISYEFWLNFCVNLLGIFSLMLIDLSLEGSVSKNLKKYMLAASTVIFFILPFFNVAALDRETILFILTLPWIINKLLGLKSGLSVIILAAFGFSIKQYDYLYPAMLILLTGDLGKGYIKRVFSRENLLMAAAVVAINVFFVLRFTEYYTELLPILLTAYKGYYEPAYSVMVSSLFAFAILIFFFRKERSLKPYIRNYIILFIVSFIMIILNGNVRYNLNYTLSAVALGLFHLLAVYKNEQIKYTLKLVLNMALVLTLMLQATFLYFISKDSDGSERTKCQQHLTRYTSKPYIYLSAGSWGFQQNYSSHDMYYFDNTNHQLALDHLWMLPWLYNNIEKPQAGPVKDYVAKKIREALGRTTHPYIIVVNSNVHKKLPEHPELMKFFKNELGLKKELAGYRKIDSINNCAPYNIDKVDIFAR